jgi:hypothetical protein
MRNLNYLWTDRFSDVFSLALAERASGEKEIQPLFAVGGMIRPVREVMLFQGAQRQFRIGIAIFNRQNFWL